VVRDIGLRVEDIADKRPGFLQGFWFTAWLPIIYGTAAGVKHYVALSVVGTERIPDSPCLRAKNAQETLIKGGGIPYSIVHATQFFEFVKRIAARNDPREVVVDPHARYFGAELGERSLVPLGDARLGEIRFEDWLNQPVLQQR
jgi:hypothetical protein